jgi:hypothetical protein
MMRCASSPTVSLLGPFGRSETTEFTPGPILSEVTVEWALKRVEERAAGTWQELFHSANNEENQKGNVWHQIWHHDSNSTKYKLTQLSVGLARLLKLYVPMKLADPCQRLRTCFLIDRR